jgi:uncharacterized protein YceK
VPQLCIILPLLVVLTSGCATYGYRLTGTEGQTKGVYPATQMDVEMMQYAHSGGGGWSAILMDTDCILDLPFSGVFDTLLLPYDLAKKREESPLLEEERSKE